MMRLPTALLLCFFLACTAWGTDVAPAADEQPATVEFRLLGQGQPARLALGKTSQYRSGKRIPVPGTEENVFAGTIVTLKPTLNESGDIAYEGSLEVIDFQGFDSAANGALAPRTRSETVALKGVLSNHQAVAVALPELGRTVYFALDDPARPKKDCAACGPRDKGELAKPNGT
ncbi:hypothetical protein H5P28_02390 [Ruficoccus amylovorans]|uniref:Uncharacterized protein n=1 Tax=Ruficoccus amylovorans TaxID=1804625 RepID=A0A842HCH9_9BACT|nr:hypothetical protein [Ruficoccus amylovorans]MBC2593101.1 hypothetical protein [Ruficoccus amylovorans]